MLRLTQAHVHVSTDVSHHSTDISTDIVITVAVTNVSTDVSPRVTYVTSDSSNSTCHY